VTELVPLPTEGVAEAGGEPAARAKKSTGGGSVNTNGLNIKQCCNALRAQATKLGPSAEANEIVAVATSCDVVATQVAADGAAPELSQLRQLLKSVKLPSLCQF